MTLTKTHIERQIDERISIKIIEKNRKAWYSFLCRQVRKSIRKHTRIRVQKTM